MPRRTSVFGVVSLSLLLSIISIILVYSASRRNFGYSLALRQSVWVLIGVMIAYLIGKFPRRLIFSFRWLVYLISLVLLVLTLFIGVEIRGERSWLNFGYFNVQSAELMKLSLIIVFAVISEKMITGEFTTRKGIFLLFITFLLPLISILYQPDLGTATIYIQFFVLWIFIIGLWRETAAAISIGAGLLTGLFSSIKGFGILNNLAFYFSYLGEEFVYENLHYISGSIVVVFFFVIVMPYIYNRRLNPNLIPILFVLSIILGVQSAALLEDYQRQRLQVYYDPYQAPLKSGYNVIQSQIAIGSGGLFGQGYLQGNQSQLGFIPELWTDFIFSIAIEELGSTFGFMLLSVIILLIYSVFSAAALAPDWKGFLVCSGIGLIWILHAYVNLGVCVGLIPVIGLPLPFISYGGSFMIVNWFMVGVLISVSRREGPTRFKEDGNDTGHFFG